MGNLLVCPVRDVWARRFRDAVAENGGPRHGCVFLQGPEVEDFRAGLSTRQRRELDHRGDMTMRMDPWEVGHLYGYDAAEVVR